ncbi:hypothetical protein BDK51DRAFT_50101 [Blyttiomyces helicus]|uniref:Uncharacterized protein n=1 Tax=Blyttiomyces helicus TaxID=388810 RepID=A0A4V1ISD1_9FUNG|nr:hypothetical protein BDK51DRAFT_50101 [Blyttiomyces helicus]|eukprot:RKO93137.1 hypothetical protein BDK51DRAFT_50101 [Blyttiomyces helicus]
MGGLPRSRPVLAEFRQGFPHGRKSHLDRTVNSSFYKAGGGALRVRDFLEHCKVRKALYGSLAEAASSFIPGDGATTDDLILILNARRGELRLAGGAAFRRSWVIHVLVESQALRQSRSPLFPRAHSDCTCQLAYGHRQASPFPTPSSELKLSPSHSFLDEAMHVSVGYVGMADEWNLDRTTDLSWMVFDSLFNKSVKEPISGCDRCFRDEYGQSGQKDSIVPLNVVLTFIRGEVADADDAAIHTVSTRAATLGLLKVVKTDGDGEFFALADRAGFAHAEGSRGFAEFM